uniref:S100/CaBP-9k-type calcium binding subdomain domain-containing protein n=1 Tax=Stegastes partitus TaxID=144197 RepID=A0A3B4ZS18_9TELE
MLPLLNTGSSTSTNTCTYSAKEGDKHKLNNKELKSLLQGELSDFLADCNESRVVEKIMHDLDENGDTGEAGQLYVLYALCTRTISKEHFRKNSPALPPPNHPEQHCGCCGVL